MSGRSWLRGMVQVVGVGALAYLLWWGAASLRLEIDGRAFVWPTAVGFGMVWAVRDGMVRHASALVVGALVGVLPVPVALDRLPLTPGGSGVAIAVAAAAVAAFVLIRWVPTGSTAVGLGTGIAASQAAGMDASTSSSDVLAAATATAFAVLLGVLGAGVLRDFASRWAEESAPERRGELLPGDLAIETGLTEEVPVPSEEVG